MTLEERVEILESRLAQAETANQIMFGLLATWISDPKWKDLIENPQDAANWIMLAAGSREDDEDHIAAEILNGIAQKLMVE